MTVVTVNPANGSVFATYDETPPDEVDAILDSSGRLAAQRHYGFTGVGRSGANGRPLAILQNPTPTSAREM
jgi:hypothetical protein